MSISVCLIVKNEEEVLERCLTCAAKFADEIIVIDTGSTDGTVAIARRFTDSVFFFEWCDDFSAARNFAFENATGEYVMWLDADDVITDGNCQKIKELVNAGGFDMAYLPYAAAFDNDKPTFVYYRERIMKASMNFRFEGAVHEAIVPRGKRVYLDAPILHKKVKSGDPLRNLSILQRKIARGDKLDGRSKFYYGRELFFNKMYSESCAVLEDYLSGDGWIENKLEACVNLYHAYIALGREQEGINALLKSLTLAPPRSDVCCILGERAMKANDNDTAIFWYELALRRKPNIKGGGFINLDYCGFIPNIQLCVLYDRLGERQKAIFYNEAAGAEKPDNPAYLHNKEYFKNKLN
ncbi:MAG: glycosyltransferase [Clostridiales bacterium]|nr:glycosyltransferase [Clostridiales bacterium]